MPGDGISKLLKLFCIVESGEVTIEPSSESWLVFSFLLVASVLFTVFGLYFQMRLANLSATLCFTLSVAGCGLTLVAFLAIILGYNRRRNYRLSNRSNGVGTTDARPVIAQESIYVDIETDFVGSSHNSESQQQWLNPIYMGHSQTSSNDTENDQQWMKTAWVDDPAYDTEPDSYEDEDFKEQESEYYDSSETGTIYYSSSPEDDDCNQIKSEESYLNEVDGSYFGSIQTDYSSSIKLEDEIVRNSNSVEYACIYPNLIEEGDNMQQYLLENQDAHVNLSLGTHKQMSRATVEHPNDFHQTELDTKSQDAQLTSIVHEKYDHITHGIGRNDCQTISEQLNNFHPPKTHDKCQNIYKNSNLLVDDDYVVINIEDSQSTIEICDSFHPSQQASCQNPNETRNLFATQRQLSRLTLDFPNGFADHNIKFSDETEHAGRKKWKWSERTEDDMFRIKKRPLLDANGNPISQYAFVQELTELLRNGLKQFPEHQGKKCI